MACSASSTLGADSDVFISSGEDTRKGFTSHLDGALKRIGISTCLGDDSLERGDEISPERKKAIEQAKVSVIVFSKTYASLRWRMGELLKIVECHKKGQIVVPIFYDIDHSDVRNQSGSFEKAFAKDKQDVKKKKEALVQVANFLHWDCRANNRTEFQMVEDIVKHVSKELIQVYDGELDLQKKKLERLNHSIKKLTLRRDLIKPNVDNKVSRSSN